MNFPDTPFYQILYAIINTPAVGGIVVGLLGLGIVIAIFFTLRWIASSSQEDEDSYAYPTTALHHDE